MNIKRIKDYKKKFKTRYSKSNKVASTFVLVLIAITVLASLALLSGCGKDSERTELIPGPSGSQGSVGNIGAAGQNGSNGAAGLGSTPGISCAVYNLPTYSNSTTLPEAFIGNTIVGVFTLPAFNIPDSLAVNGFPGMPAAIQNVVGTDGYALDCYGYLNVTTSGDNYVFQLLSDDGSELRINDTIVISNQGQHAPSSVTSSATHLDRGLNKINIVYYQGPLTQIALQLSLAGPNLPNAVVPASAYTH